MKTYDENQIRTEYANLTRTLIEKGLTITTMESATAGQIASLITDTEGSSAVIKGAFITYSNEAKIMQGVPEAVIDKYSVYSVETASSMADSCRRAFDADIGIGVTGTMGNVDPANEETSEPGKVFFAVATGGKLEKDIVTNAVEISPQKNRLAYKMAVAKEVYDVLIEVLG